MFEDIKGVFWIPKIALYSDREVNIRDCFTEQKVYFKYLNNVEDFNDLLEFYQRKKIKLSWTTFQALLTDQQNFPTFQLFQKILPDMCLYFSYHLPDKTALANDTFTDKNT